MDDPHKLIGTEIGERYLIRAVLGRGGNAVVLRAADAVRGGDVALKIYGADGFDVQTAEAATQFQVSDGSAVLPLWDVHTDFLEGSATAMPIMKSTLADEALVLVSNAVHITRRVLTALEFCHGRGVIHGDIKPPNIFFDEDRNVRLGDFGAVKKTIEYASPELVAGEQKDELADLWATAVTFHEVLVGAMPFGAVGDLTETEVAERILAGARDSPDNNHPFLPLKFRRFFDTAFAGDPAARYGAAAEMRRALKDLAVHVEWVRLFDPPAITFEGSEIDAAGSFTGVRYKASMHEKSTGAWIARIDRASPGGNYRKLTRLEPFEGSKKQVGFKLQVWMRTLTEHGRIA